MGNKAARRRVYVIALGVAVLLLLLALATLNAFNLPFLNPNSPLQTVGYVSISTFGFLLFVCVLVLLVRNVLKLYADQRSKVLGTRLRTRMLWGAVLVSLVPLVFMFAFSYLLMNRAVDRWFSQPVTQMRDDANRMAVELFHYAALNSRSEADSIAAALSDVVLTPADKVHPERLAPAVQAQVDRELTRHQLTLQGGFAILYREGKPVASFQAPNLAKGGMKSLQPAEAESDESPSRRPAMELRPLDGSGERAVLQAAQRADDPVYAFNGTDYTLATAGLRRGGVVLVALPIPPGISATTARLRTNTDAYWTLFRERRQVRSLYMVLLLLMTALALFACCWLALNLAKQVTQPVESLADAMEAIAGGDYAHRVQEGATEELGELVASFNAMAADLESARAEAEQSTAQLSELNSALVARRSELETIIETIPNGLATLSVEGTVILANRAFSEMLDPGGQKPFVGQPISAILPAEVMETLDRLQRRAHRMGVTSAEVGVALPSGVLQLSLTVALLESSGREPLGYVLVLEDITQLLHAQKQSAWKEVARRVAHEIKNPLTPISLNAELIGRHMARLAPELEAHGIESRSPAVVQRSTEVITASVTTLRGLVDQFSSLAEFPSARPRPADLNAIVENSLSLFAGRLGNIRVVRKLAPDLPLVLADAEALKRALSNLIDNAAEALSESLLRELRVSTRLLDSGMVELAVADSGPGITDDMRERLFLPYFSTKQRGTGLGLSIAAKIVQEHGGTIRVEKNTPAGARFLIELRPASDPGESANAGSAEPASPSTPAPHTTGAATLSIQTPSSPAARRNSETHGAPA